MKSKESYVELRARGLLRAIDSCQISIDELSSHYNEKISAKLKRQSDELSSCKKHLERGLYAKPSFLRTLSLLFYMQRARGHIKKAHKFF